MTKKEIEDNYAISRRIEAEERALETATMVLTSTQQEIDEQWGLYDGYGCCSLCDRVTSIKLNGNWIGVPSIAKIAHCCWRTLMLSYRRTEGWKSRVQADTRRAQTSVPGAHAGSHIIDLSLVLQVRREAGGSAARTPPSRAHDAPDQCHPARPGFQQPQGGPAHGPRAGRQAPAQARLLLRAPLQPLLTALG